MVQRIRSFAPEEIAVSTITVAELEYGIAKSGQPDRNRVAMVQFLVPFAILDFDQGASAQYGLIRSGLEAAGTPIGPMGMLLAAQALASDLTLVTNNTREFERVVGLKVENWVDDSAR